MGGGILREFGMDMYTLLYLKWITNKSLVYLEFCSMLCGSLDGRGVWGSVGTCKSLRCSPEAVTTLLTGYEVKK